MVFSIFAGGPNTCASPPRAPRAAPRAIAAPRNPAPTVRQALARGHDIALQCRAALLGPEGSHASAHVSRRRIKEQQIAFQALKKKTGNTFTAKAMPLNIAAVFTIIIGGFVLVPMNLYSVANGKNKIKLN